MNDTKFCTVTCLNAGAILKINTFSCPFPQRAQRLQDNFRPIPKDFCNLPLSAYSRTTRFYRNRPIYRDLKLPLLLSAEWLRKDNEHPLSWLGDLVICAVKHTPFQTIPQFRKRFKNCFVSFPLTCAYLQNKFWSTDRVRFQGEKLKVFWLW